MGSDELGSWIALTVGSRAMWRVVVAVGVTPRIRYADTDAGQLLGPLLRVLEMRLCRALVLAANVTLPWLVTPEAGDSHKHT